MSGDILLAFFLVSPEEEWADRLRAKYPGLEVRWALAVEENELVDLERLPSELWAGVTILMIPSLGPSARLMKSVRFVQSTASGLDQWHSHPAFNDPNVVFANSRGVTG